MYTLAEIQPLHCTIICLAYLQFAVNEACKYK